MKRLLILLLIIFQIGAFKVTVRDSYTDFCQDADTIIGCWRFNEDGHTKTHDDSNGGIVSTNPGNFPDYTTSGKEGGAYDFNGTADWIGFSTIADFDLTTLSIVGWVNCAGDGNYRTIMSKQNNANTSRNFWFGKNASDKLSFGFSSLGSSKFDEGDQTDICDGAWHHVGVTFSQPDITYYVDGVEDDSASINFAPDTNTGTQDTNIGATDVEGLYWDDKIDEVLITSDVLTATEIKEIYDFGLR